jgi:NADP-dependent aldehyde dehydrogenase
MLELHGMNYLGAELCGAGERTFRARDPKRGSDLAPAFREATAEEVDRAVRLAEAAFEGFRRVTPEDRARFLERIAAEIEALDDALIERAGQETALPAARLEGERARTVNQIRMFAALVREGSWVEACIDRPMPERKPLPKPDVRRMLVPLGPVAVFGASNFPLAFSVAGGDTASALAAGCPVVVKAHPAHPGTSELVAGAIRKAVADSHLPAGVFSLVHGTGPEVGLALARHPAMRAVAFTGSLAGGRALFDAAAARPSPIPVYAEMGSANPVFLLPGALGTRGPAIAGGLQQSVTLGVGQFCTNPGIVVALAGPVFDAFAAELGGAMEKSPPGTMLHGGIRGSYEAGLAALCAVPGVKEVARSAAPPDPAQNQVAAVVLETDAGTFLANDSLAGEVFGPSTLLVQCAGRTELLRLAQSLDGHLTATLHGSEEDLAEYAELIDVLALKVGRLIVNGFPTGVEVCASIQHGGPYPATTDSRSTSVGTAAIERFARPVCYQGFPQTALPCELRDRNECGIWRRIDGELTREDA